MLSIIVSSIDNKRFHHLEFNISNTLGDLAYEIIRIDNANLQLDISKVYNIGWKKSRYPYLLFIHEDIIIHTKNWGRLLIDYFKTDSEIGLIGIAGTKVKTKTPTGWWENDPDSWVMNLIQHYKNQEKEKIFRGFKNTVLEETVIIDGVFIAMRKDNNILFDERLPGFHNYDQSISLLYRQNNYKIFVTREILVEHLSIGHKTSSWKESTALFYKLYKHLLPQVVNNKKITRTQKAYSYMRLFNNNNGSNSLSAFRFFLTYWYLKPFSSQSYRMFKRLIHVKR